MATEYSLNRIKVIVLLIFILFSVFTYGQDSISNTPPGITEEEAVFSLPMYDLVFILSMAVLTFGFLIIVLEIYLIKTQKIGSENAFKLIIITLIIFATLFLITAGYSNDQIAPAVGLLGTIAGYLLGKINYKDGNGKIT
jgi:glycerol uptake facilitator-like aquaporin